MYRLLSNAGDWNIRWAIGYELARTVGIKRGSVAQVDQGVWDHIFAEMPFSATKLPLEEQMVELQRKIQVLGEFVSKQPVDLSAAERSVFCHFQPARQHVYHCKPTAVNFIIGLVIN